jgi:hypothetical protein
MGVNWFAVCGGGLCADTGAGEMPAGRSAPGTASFGTDGGNQTRFGTRPGSHGTVGFLRSGLGDTLWRAGARIGLCGAEDEATGLYGPRLGGICAPLATSIRGNLRWGLLPMGVLTGVSARGSERSRGRTKLGNSKLWLFVLSAGAGVADARPGTGAGAPKTGVGVPGTDAGAPETGADVPGTGADVPGSDAGAFEAFPMLRVFAMVLVSMVRF